jgi:acetyl-CoA acetyltransferase
MKRSKSQFAICGLGVVTGKGLKKSARTLQAEAARLAIADAGLKRSQINGAINGTAAAGSMPGGGGWIDGYSRVLGLNANFYFTVARGAIGSIVGMLAATRAIDLGLADYVVIAAGDAAYSNIRGLLDAKPLARSRAGRANSILGTDLLGFTATVSAGNIHGFLATRHMHEFGTTSEQLGAVAVAARAWANLNPEAQSYGKPLTLEDHQKSPLIVEPYHQYDCCLESDSGVAIVVTTEERAKDLARRPVGILGLGIGDQSGKQWWDKTNYTTFDVATARDAAFVQAGITLENIDVVHLYDCFTCEVIMQLEDYGFCEKGQGGPFVAAGNTAPGGTIPVNTGGGMLSGFMLFEFTGLAEIVRQLRGEGGARQVKDARVGMYSGCGGEMLMPGMCSIHGTAVLGSI